MKETKRTFFVERPEIYHQTVAIQADSIDEARILVSEGRGQDVGAPRYQCIEDSNIEEWAVSN